MCPKGYSSNPFSGTRAIPKAIMLTETSDIPDGECPSVGDVTVMSAESAFLPILFDYHARFPRLRIVLEHLSTAAAVSAVAACGKTVAASITSHHLSLIVDNWQNDVHCNCKVSISSFVHTSSRRHFEFLRRGFRGSAPIWTCSLLFQQFTHCRIVV